MAVLWPNNSVLMVGPADPEGTPPVVPINGQAEPPGLPWRKTPFSEERCENFRLVRHYIGGMVQEIRKAEPAVHRLPENADLLLRYCLELENTVARQAADLTALRQMLSSGHGRHEHALRRPRRESLWAAFRRLLHDQFSPE